MSQESYLTPREIVSELDKYIVGQNMAKRAVGVALRTGGEGRRYRPSFATRYPPRTYL